MINKYSNIPLYSQLKDILIEKIERNEYPVGSKIPSEEELCEAYDISRPTVRQAISELTSCGYLVKVKGKGTFVAKPKTFIDIKEYTGFTDSILDSKVPGEKNIVSVKNIKLDDFKRLDDVFNLPRNLKEEFVQIKYLSEIKGEICALNISYIPLSLFPGIQNDLEQKKPSYDILKGKYHLIPAKSKSSIEIEYTDIADAAYIKVQQGHPLIKIENILYSKTGQAVEFIISKYRADKCKLIFENSKSI